MWCLVNLVMGLADQLPYIYGACGLELSIGVDYPYGAQCAFWQTTPFISINSYQFLVTIGQMTS